MTMKSFQTLRNTLTHHVIEIRTITDDTFVVRFTRGGLDFISGQHLCVGPQNDINMREYSIYSGNHEDFLEILVKEVQEGQVSRQLKLLSHKDEIKVEGPFGFFTVDKNEEQRTLYGIATGTGIAPFHCFALSHPHYTFTVLHGIRHTKERYDHKVFEIPNYRYIPCVSQETTNTYYQGRVTNYLRSHDIDMEGIYFLCGNCDMIYEVFDILQQQGIPPEHIKAEVYF